ncbi:hypothetical protein VTK73DRAFT_6064 [Phialemonium thermophilum]|uniref:Ribosomal protein S18 n=1 Tax=Phialemonium thermophilum TaxID=223376 RepID=A0ABR3WLA1_9PEZI
MGAGPCDTLAKPLGGNFSSETKLATPSIARSVASKTKTVQPWSLASMYVRRHAERAKGTGPLSFRCTGGEGGSGLCKARSSSTHLKGRQPPQDRSGLLKWEGPRRWTNSEALDEQRSNPAFMTVRNLCPLVGSKSYTILDKEERCRKQRQRSFITEQQYTFGLRTAQDTKEMLQYARRAFFPVLVSSF